MFREYFGTQARAARTIVGIIVILFLIWACWSLISQALSILLFVCVMAFLYKVIFGKSSRGGRH